MATQPMPDDYSQPSDYVYEEMPTPVVSDEIWKLILDRSKIPGDLAHKLAGEVYIVKENKKGELIGRWVEAGKPLMNKEGIRFFMSILTSAMTPDKLATFLTELEVNRMAKDMTKTIIYIIAERGDEFEIDASNRSYIVETFDHFYFANLTSSRKGTILNALKPMYERKEVYTPMPKQGRLKLPSFLGGRK